MLLKKLRLLLITSLLCSQGILWPTQWIGPGRGGSWNQPSNWEGGIVPNGPTATATIPTPTSNINIGSITLDVPVELETLDINFNEGFELIKSVANTLSINQDFVCQGLDDSFVSFFSGNVSLGDQSLTSFTGDTTNLTINPSTSGLSTSSTNFSSATINVFGTGELWINHPTTFAEGATMNLNEQITLNINTDTNIDNLQISDDTSLIVMSSLTSSITGNGPIQVYQGSTLNFNQAESGTYSGQISMGGSINKIDPNTFTLINSNTYTGGTTVTAGNLVGYTYSIPSQGGLNIAAAGTCTFDQASDGTFSGVISGSGSLVKEGTGTVTLSAKNTFSGDTSLNAGSLNITGTLGDGTITVAANAVLNGDGTIGAVNNNGTIQPAISGPLSAPQSLNLSGNYTQNTGATLISQINGISGAASLTLGDGYTATLDGTLELYIDSGQIYVANNPFTIITADEITNNFSTVSSSQGSWQTQISTSGSKKLLQIFPTENQAPSLAYSKNVDAPEYSGERVYKPVEVYFRNARSQGIADHLFNDLGTIFSSLDRVNIANILLKLNGEALEEALLRISPQVQAANVYSTYQNNTQMAIVLDQQFQRAAKNQSKDHKNLQYSQPKSGSFVQPIALFYNQDQDNSTLSMSTQVPFKAATYGAGAGVNYVFDNQFILEGGIGYTHTNIKWSNNFGNANWSSVYLAPFFGWFNDYGFVNAMFMWAVNFYDVNRKIIIATINRAATSSYNSYDYLLRANGGFQIFLEHGYWLQPEFTLNYLADVREKYQEVGANGLDLLVKRHMSSFLQPSFRARLIKEITSPKFCYSPNIYIGWLANIPLDNGTLTARFVQAPSDLFFNFKGGNEATNQLVLGAEFFARRFNMFELTSNFEADILSHFQIYTVKVKLEWMF